MSRSTKQPGGKAAGNSRKTDAGETEGQPSMPYVVLARKYRPHTFEDLIGQDAMVRTLRNAFATGRIAQAYMLTGVRGVGKTTTARILARALNYSKPGEDNGPTLDLAEEGEHCRAIMEGRHMDVMEMDAASHTGIDDIREITDAIRYKPAYARYKVFIIDEVHMLSKAAFNGLLKTLEEPPEHVKFIFATTEVRKVPVTVLSRCQRFDLRRVDADKLIAHFADVAEREGRRIEDEALGLIARAAEGSVRDGLSLLDTAFAHANDAVTAADVRAMLGLGDSARIYDLLEAALRGAPDKALDELGALHADGAEPERVIQDLAEAVHTASRLAVTGDGGGAALSETERERASALAAVIGVPKLARAWQMLLKGLEEVSRAPNALAAAEMVLIRLSHTADLPPPDKLIRELAEPGASPRTNREQKQNESAPTDVPDSSRAETAPPANPVKVESTPVSLKSFEDVAALAGKHRDIKLKLALEENVRLVSFRPGHIELNLLDGAPQDLANQLGNKLKAWTGERWMVSVSDQPGEKTLGEKRREQEATIRAQVEQHPLVRQVFQHFPSAEIVGVEELDTGTAPPPEERNAANSEDGHERLYEHDEAGQGAAKQNGRNAGRD
ncbi:DNA polymerase III subunit gamma/tau [Dichotomicrobium thermohalophilum]|uniref:DNA polymerase III subunit gamma/tau n=1 Tax=Dichotomicrobium thermohalophilum TaxID=933063 RepID=A0A397PJ16_9HYPH|nr:DNA polymerase III subunit gamma/tau [Dichotomicrobium thermohalophilum]RIA47275.1 DNA polymerase-3 subunit gamma/tau [Dichotomicrobium thermohalophilum]